MSGLIRNLFRSHKDERGFAFSRPLVVLQSDDWGRVGVRDREGYEQLRAGGLRLGERAYDLYTLETADDVRALAALLDRHRDSTGRRPCMVMNVCTANLDFKKMRSDGYKALKLLPLAEGLPGSWSRPGLLEAYRDGCKRGVFYPGLHGANHFCPVAVENALAQDGDRAEQLRLLWQAETPYIFWRMPWVGYEYWNPEKPDAGFLPEKQQKALVEQAIRNFSAVFGFRPRSACAPGFRANRDTHAAWFREGIRVAESGTESGVHAPHLDEVGILHLYRVIDFEPSQRDLEIDKYLEIAGKCFSRGLPLTISVHSINFHSTLKNFRDTTIAALDRFLSALESRYNELLYVHDWDIYAIVNAGAFRIHGTRTAVTVQRLEIESQPATQGAV